METTFRNVIHQEDIEQVRRLCTSTGFFREDEIAVAVELVTEAFEKGQEQSEYYFIFSMNGNETTGFVCFGPTPCTVGTYDLYWIVVGNSYRGKGIGLKLLLETEKALTGMNARKLYIETSSTDKYLPTRNFYLKGNYTEEARLKDFYLPGDDKVIYARLLQ